jgi:hypothetical protein
MTRWLPGDPEEQRCLAGQTLLSGRPDKRVWPTNTSSLISALPWRYLVAIAIAVFAVLPVGADDEQRPRLDPDMPYEAQRLNPITYDVEFVVTVTPPHRTKLLRVWLPLPPSEVGQKVSGSELTTFPGDVPPRVLTENRFGNRFAYFEFQ